MEALDREQTHMVMMIKGKRTKRQRTSSPLALTMASTSSSSEGSAPNYNIASDNSHGTGVVSSIEFTQIVHEEQEEQEEDMANCLILLAQGQGRHKVSSHDQSTNGIRAPNKAIGLYVYECKTCNRTFNSFQALGGHRASHKKPKPSTSLDEKRPFLALVKDDDELCNHNSATTLSLQISPNMALCRSSTSTSNKGKVHECSICGAEFTSGQALGGHMRRHRTMPVAITTTTTTTTSGTSDDSREGKKSRTLLSLDLNLPAPEDDRSEMKFPFGTKDQMIVFSASSLVDCHF